jgi:hypothetical protein
LLSFSYFGFLCRIFLPRQIYCTNQHAMLYFSFATTMSSKSIKDLSNRFWISNRTAMWLTVTIRGTPSTSSVWNHITNHFIACPFVHEMQVRYDVIKWNSSNSSRCMGLLAGDASYSWASMHGQLQTIIDWWLSLIVHVLRAVIRAWHST